MTKKNELTIEDLENLDRIRRYKEQICKRCGGKREEHIVLFGTGSDTEGNKLLCPVNIFEE